MTIVEAARGRRKERSTSREVKARRATEAGKASLWPSRSRSRDKRADLDSPKGVKVKVEMTERTDNHQKISAKLPCPYSFKSRKCPLSVARNKLDQIVSNILGKTKSLIPRRKTHTIGTPSTNHISIP